MEQCPICNGDVIDGAQTSVLGQKGVNTLNQNSQGTLRFKVGQKVHVKCRRDFCRDAERLICKMSGYEDSSNSLGGTTRRSTKPAFIWKEHCLFCGGVAKYDGKKKGFDVTPVRTMDFEHSIRESCRERNDDWAETVLGRLEFATADLHAADAVYHNQCSINFRTGKQIPRQYLGNQDENPPKRQRSGRPHNARKADAFRKVTQFLEENEDDMITVNDLCQKMEEFLEGSEEAYSAIHMRKKLEEHFGSQIIITTTAKKSGNVVTFKRSMASIIQEFHSTLKKGESPEEEKKNIVETAAQLLKSEIKGIDAKGDTYPSSEEMASTERSLEFIPELLKLFLRTLLCGKNIDLKLASIGQALIQGTRPRALLAPLQLGLAVQMHHHFSSKFLIDTLCAHGFSTSYGNVQNFERSAAVSQGTDIPNFSSGSFVQHVADNIDHNVRTLDGLGTFHGMGIIATVTPGTTTSTAVPIRTVSKEQIVAAGKIQVRHYTGSIQEENPLVYKELEDLKVKDPTANIDLLLNLTQPLLQSPRPAWSGTMQMLLDGSHPGKSAIIFLPMIDMDPSDMSCIFSTLHFVANQAARYNVTPILTFDQPLWWKALRILRNEPSGRVLKSIILRLGDYTLR